MNSFEKAIARLFKPETDTGGEAIQLITPRISDSVSMSSRIRIYNHPSAYTYSFADYTTGTLIVDQTGVFTTAFFQWVANLLSADRKTISGQNKKGIGALRLLNGGTTVHDIATPVDHQRIVDWTEYGVIFELLGSEPTTQPATINKIQIFKHGTTNPLYGEISFTNVSKLNTRKWILEFGVIIP